MTSTSEIAIRIYHTHIIQYILILYEIADSLNIDLSTSINSVPTQYTDNLQDLNSVIKLMFLHSELEKFNNHQIIPEVHSLLDHTSLLVSVTIKEGHI